MSLRGSHPDLYERNADGSGTDALIFTAPQSEEYPMAESRDGRFILFRQIRDYANFELAYLSAGEKQATPFLKASFGYSDAAFSPDGRWVAYASNESGRWEIYVAPFPGPGGNWKISSNGGTEPAWRADGKELFYLAVDGRLMAVAVKEGPPFEAGAAEALFQTHERERIASTDIFSYDVSPDGQRVLINTDFGETTSAPLNLVLHGIPR
jgi:Tol biopolymer transport system component